MKKLIFRFFLNNFISNFIIRSLGLENKIYYRSNPYLSFKLSGSSSTQVNAGYSDRPEINEVLLRSKSDLKTTVSEFCIENSKILDIGCGPGMYLELFKTSVYHLSAIDISQAMLDDAKKLVPQAQFIKGDFIELPITKQFKFIYCMGVLIYIPPHSIKVFFKKIYDSLEPNGILYLNYPHAISWLDTVYHDITYMQYSPAAVEKFINPYFNIIKHQQAFDGRKVGAYDKEPYKSLNGNTKKTYKNSYLLIAQKRNNG